MRSSSSSTLEAVNHDDRTVYRLPRWPLTRSRLLGGWIFLVLAALAAALGVTLLIVGLLTGWGWNGLILTGGLPGLAVVLALFEAHAILRGRHSVSAERTRLRFLSGTFGNRSARERQLSEIACFVVHPLIDDVGVALQGLDDPGVLEVVGCDLPSLWIVEGYRRDLLHELARRLVRHCKRDRRSTATAEDGPPVSCRKLDELLNAPVRDEEATDLKTRPASTRWEITRTSGGVDLRQPASAVEGLSLLLPFVICAAVGVWVLAAGMPEPREPLAVVLGVSLLLACGVLVLFGIHLGTLERRLMVRDGRILRSEFSRLVPRMRPQHWYASEVQAVRTSLQSSGKGKKSWTLLCTVNGLTQVLYTSTDGDEVRWLATELRAALGVPAVPRPEAEAPPSRP